MIFASCFATHPASAGEVTPYAYRLAVTPHPQEVYVNGKSADGFRFDSDSSFHAMHADDLPGANLLAGDVGRRYGMKWEPGMGHRGGDEGNAIWIARNTDELQIPGDANVMLEVNHLEGYSIVGSTAGILIRGADARGVVYGIQTLRQLLRHDLSVAGLAIRDWPEMPKRMV